MYSRQLLGLRRSINFEACGWILTWFVWLRRAWSVSLEVDFQQWHSLSSQSQDQGYDQLHLELSKIKKRMVKVQVTNFAWIYSTSRMGLHAETLLLVVTNPLVNQYIFIKTLNLISINTGQLYTLSKKSPWTLLKKVQFS